MHSSNAIVIALNHLKHGQSNENLISNYACYLSAFFAALVPQVEEEEAGEKNKVEAMGSRFGRLLSGGNLLRIK